MDTYFNERFVFLVLFVFIVGVLGDILIHIGTHLKFPFGRPWFAQGLIPYYKSMEIGKNKLSKVMSSYILSGIAGGIACVIAVVFGQLLLYAMESNESSI